MELQAIGVRIPAYLVEALDRVAARETRNRTQQLTRILEAALAAEVRDWETRTSIDPDEHRKAPTPSPTKEPE